MRKDRTDIQEELRKKIVPPKSDLRPISVVHNDEKWSRIEEYVGDVLIDIFYLDRDNNIYVIGTEAARFAEYAEAKSKASDVWRKIKKYLPESMTELTGMSDLHTPSNKQQARFYTNELVHYFIMHLGTSQKVSLLLQGYALIFEKFRKGELTTKKSGFVTDLLLPLQEVTKALQLGVTRMNQTDQKVTEIDIKHTKREEKLEIKIKSVKKDVKELKTTVLTIEDRKQKNEKVSELQGNLAKMFSLLGDKTKPKAYGRFSRYVRRYFRVHGYTNIPDRKIDEYILFLKQCLIDTEKYKEIPVSLRYDVIPTLTRVPETLKQMKLP